MGDIDIAMGAIPLLGVVNVDRGGIDGGGIGLMKLLLPLLVVGLNKLVQDASRKFWRSFDGVDEYAIVVIRLLILLEDCAGDRMEDTARLR